MQLLPRQVGGVSCGRVEATTEVCFSFAHQSLQARPPAESAGPGVPPEQLLLLAGRRVQVQRLLFCCWSGRRSPQTLMAVAGAEAARDASHGAPRPRPPNRHRRCRCHRAAPWRGRGGGCWRPPSPSEPEHLPLLRGRAAMQAEQPAVAVGLDCLPCLPC